jgi:hypothetical protein
VNTSCEYIALWFNILRHYGNERCIDGLLDVMDTIHGRFSNTGRDVFEA